MISCPGCGGGLRFDIASQRLVCDSCQSNYDPYQFDVNASNAEETTEYDATVYTCPQCGAELISTDQEAAVFCSYCGASHVLEGRLTKEKRPKYILPFTKTKQDCKDAYSKWMKQAIFAPKELRDPAYIDGFRGIYMPYWVYDFEQQGELYLQSEKSYRLGDFIITDTYETSTYLDAEYKGLSSDASSSYADSISETIAPYQVKEVKDFSPAFLSGFYADTADVPSDVYEADAESIAVKTSLKQLRSDSSIPAGAAITRTSSGNQSIPSRLTDVQPAMFPVWFLSYRKNDRIAYAVINGQTGKISADLPVDQKKYVISSLLLAIPIFLILNMGFTLLPGTILTISVVLTVCSMLLYAREQRAIRRLESGEADRGLMSLKKTGSDSNDRALDEGGFRTLTDGRQFGEKPKKEKHKGASSQTASQVSSPTSGSSRGFILGTISIAIAVVVTVLHPVSDTWYYLGAILSMLAELGLILEIIRSYNFTATRPLPQFNRKDGDDRA